MRKPKKADALGALNLEALSKNLAAEADKISPKKTSAEVRADAKKERAEKLAALVAAVTPAIKVMRAKRLTFKEIATVIAAQANGFMIPVRVLKEAAGEMQKEKPAAATPKPAAAKTAPAAKS